MTAQTETKKGLTGWHVLIITAIAFGVVFAVNITFIVLSLETFTGEDVPDAYDRGIAYNDILEERAAQVALGWTAAFGAELTQGTTARVTVDLADAAGAPVTGATVDVLFRRTTHDGEDRALTLTDAGGGAYTGDIDLPGAGLWDIRGHAARGEDERLDFEDRLWLE